MSLKQEELELLEIAKEITDDEILLESIEILLGMTIGELQVCKQQENLNDFVFLLCNFIERYKINLIRRDFNSTL